MKLNEWKDKDGNPINLNTNSVSNKTSTGSFKRRLDKLIKYYGQHLPGNVDNLVVTLLTDDSLVFEEHLHNNMKINYNIYIGPATEAWRLKIFVDGTLAEDLSGMGWIDLLKTLRTYITVPVTTTPAYKELLTEWVDKDGNKINLNNSSTSTPTTSSPTKTHKEKFEELTTYMKVHAGKTVDKAEVLRIDAGGFTYKEHRTSATGNDFTLTVLVGYSRFNEQWKYELYMDTSLIEEKRGDGFKELIHYLYDYFNTPMPGSKECLSLCEWVDEKGNKIDLTKNSSTTSQSGSSIADDFRTYENLWD